MEIFLAFVVFVLFFIAMALGLMLKGEPLKGSCGGVAKLMGNEECEICGGNPNKCDEYNNGNDASPDELAYDATKKR